MLNDECEKALKEERKKHEVSISSYAFRLGWDAALELFSKNLDKAAKNMRINPILNGITKG